MMPFDYNIGSRFVDRLSWDWPGLSLTSLISRSTKPRSASMASSGTRGRATKAPSGALFCLVSTTWQPGPGTSCLWHMYVHCGQHLELSSAIRCSTLVPVFSEPCDQQTPAISGQFFQFTNWVFWCFFHFTHWPRTRHSSRISKHVGFLCGRLRVIVVVVWSQQGRALKSHHKWQTLTSKVPILIWPQMLLRSKTQASNLLTGYLLCQDKTGLDAELPVEDRY